MMDNILRSKIGNYHGNDGTNKWLLGADKLFFPSTTVVVTNRNLQTLAMNDQCISTSTINIDDRILFGDDNNHITKDTHMYLRCGEQIRLRSNVGQDGTINNTGHEARFDGDSSLKFDSRSTTVQSSVIFQNRNDNESSFVSARINELVPNRTPGSETGGMKFRARNAGAMTTYLTIRKGVRLDQLPNAPGLGTDSNGLIISTSDERVKHVLNKHRDFTFGLEPCVFEYDPESGIDLRGDDDKPQKVLGFTAQDVRKHLPLAVRSNKNGGLMVDTTALVANLVNCVGNLHTRVKTLESTKNNI